MEKALEKLGEELYFLQAMKGLVKILKDHWISMQTKMCLMRMFPLLMYGCEKWTIRKKEYIVWPEKSNNLV